MPTPSNQRPMIRPRLIRGLRIAWSAWWGVLCVLLLVLWVRSFPSRTWKELFVTRTSSWEFHSFDGTLLLLQRTRVFITLEMTLAYPDDLFTDSFSRFGVGYYSDGLFRGVYLPYWL